MPTGDFVLPIWVFRELGKLNQPVRSAGTGFVIAPHLFVTCWHCVNAPLGPDESYGVSRDFGEAKVALPLKHISQDGNGTDLATAEVNLDESHFRLAERNIGPLHPVRTFGYPLTDRRGNIESPQFRLNERVLRGYVTRYFFFEHQKYGMVKSYELDMSAPAGISGAPLICEVTGDVVGVVYGTNDEELVESLASVDTETGQRRAEILRVTSFALAFPIETLRRVTGVVTGGIPLGERVGFLSSPESR